MVSLHWATLALFLSLSSKDLCSLAAYIPEEACEIHSEPGDVQIGGIFPIYLTTDTDDDACVGGYNSQYISMVETMVYAIRLVNQRHDVLPNVTLGYDIRVNCLIDDITVWNMMSMLSPAGNDEYEKFCPARSDESGKVIGIIGPSASSTSLIIESIASVFTTPLISYWATSDELSNKDRFEYFLRTVPPDKFQVEAIVDILLRFNWKYIALFYSIDSYGLHGAGHLQKLAEILDICISINLPVSNSPSVTERRDIADKLIENDKVRVIVIFSVSRAAYGVHQAILEHDIKRPFTFLGSDGWGADHHFVKFEGADNLLHGSLFIRHYSQQMEDFHEYYQELPNKQHLTSQWYQNMIDTIWDESECSEWNSCPIPEPFKEVDVTNAVFALAFALDNSIKNNCLNDNLCDEAIEGNTFLANLMGVSFFGPGGHFKFDENGDPSGKYSIQSWQPIEGVYSMVDVGVWDPDDEESRLRINEDLIDWGSVTEEVPVSLCIETCGPNEIPIPIKKKCCMGCFTCPDHAKVVNASRCEECSLFEWPNSNYTECLPIYPGYVSLNNPIIIAIIAVSCLGIVLSMLTVISLWIYRNHQLIKASSRELSCVNLIGVTMSCIASLLTIIRPSIASCSISETCISLGFSLIYAPILLKVNRIWRIFLASSKCKQGVRFASPKDQLIMTSASITIQFIIICWSQLNDVSRPAILIPLQHQPFLSIYCQLGTGFIASCSYNMLLVTACCYYAFRARKVPSNFNESKFIAFSVYSTLIVCLSAIPVYSTAMEVTQMIAALNVALLLNSCLTLLCIYLPKLYAINFGGDLSIVTWSWKSDNNTNMSNGSSSKATDVTTTT